MGILTDMLNGSRLICQSPADKLRFMTKKSDFLIGLLKNKKLCNCVIDVQGTLFNVHLEILCAASQYFDSVIRRDYIDDRAVSLHNISPSAFSLLLGYLYTGQLEVNLCNLYDIYVAADFLVLDSVLDWCRKTLCKSFRKKVTREALDLFAKIMKRYDDMVIFHGVTPQVNLLEHKDIFGQLESKYFFEYLLVNKRIIFLADGHTLLMGQYFVWKLQEILHEIFPEETRRVTKDDCRKQQYCKPTAMVMQSIESGVIPKNCGIVSGTLPSYDCYDDPATCANYSPLDWTISRIKFYLYSPSDDDILHAIIGADVEYRNIWTGERQTAQSPLSESRRQRCSVEVIELTEGETLCSVESWSTGLLYALSFVTSTGRKVGPFGNSGEGYKIFIEANKIWPNVDTPYTCIAFHGFCYMQDGDLDCWQYVKLVFSAVRSHEKIITGRI